MNEISRRTMMSALGLGAAGTAGLLAGDPARSAPLVLSKPRPFSWELLQGRADALARQPFKPLEPVAAAHGINYDDAGAITFVPDPQLGQIRLFPVRGTSPFPVQVAVVANGQFREIPFSPGSFTSASKARALGISGFRFVTADGRSDWLAFQGASYFRAAGSQDQYGLSARGIAINSGIAGREEFPAFTDFWIERGADATIVYALLDGASVTGAFRFRCTNGRDGVVQQVSSVLHFRRDVERLGIAPATSMFWYGEGDRAHGTDWRPEIHDSDGLAMLTGAGERIWVPLVNPDTVSTRSFSDHAPKGFGLLQRDRAFDHYQDDGAFYDRRPNLWIEPVGDWGAGAVMLFAFPTDRETTDNVNAFWVPARAPKAGDTLRFDYRLRWSSADPFAAGAARATDLWRGAAGRPGLDPVKGARKLVVDFAGAGLAGLERSSGTTIDVGVQNGRVLSSAAYPVVGASARWRAIADIAPDAGKVATVRLFLRRGTGALSETVLAEVPG